MSKQYNKALKRGRRERYLKRRRTTAKTQAARRGAPAPAPAEAPAGA